MKKIIKLKEVIKKEGFKLSDVLDVIPMILSLIEEIFSNEVEDLVGPNYSRDNENTRWGSNPSSIKLQGKNYKISVPRVKNKQTGKFIPLETYKELKSCISACSSFFNSVLNGVSVRKYSNIFDNEIEGFGLSKSSVSRHFKEASSKLLNEFFSRDLNKEDIVAIFIDGKHLMGSQATIALGVTMEGQKIPLGFVESSSENSESCIRLLNDLIERGLPENKEILFILDGSKALRKAVKDVFGNKAIVQRCQWHKRKNILSYLPKSNQEYFKRKLQDAYEQDSYAKAKRKLKKIYKELKLINMDAANSLKEGLEETLTLHKLGVFHIIGKSFKTTNCIENLNRGVRDRLGRVCKWKNSDHRRRWLASALIDMEPRFNLVEGYKKLPSLRRAMQVYNSRLNFFSKMVA